MFNDVHHSACMYLRLLQTFTYVPIRHLTVIAFERSAIMSYDDEGNTPFLLYSDRVLDTKGR